MEIKIDQVDSLFSITIDGTVIPNVSDYKIISSAHDGTELDLKIVTKDSIKEFVSSTQCGKTSTPESKYRRIEVITENKNQLRAAEELMAALKLNPFELALLTSSLRVRPEFDLAFLERTYPSTRVDL